MSKPFIATLVLIPFAFFGSIVLALAVNQASEEARTEAVRTAALASPPAPAVTSYLLFEEGALTLCVESDYAQPDEALIPVTGNCRQAARRPVLATCALEHGMVHLYDFESVFLSDNDMRRCLNSGGRWETLERGSLAHLQAQIQDAQQRSARASR